MNKYMKQFLLFVGVGSLAFSLACGGGGNNNNGGGGFGGGGGTGSFSNASLNGHYAYQLKGYSLVSGDPFREAGVFTADGNGHITSGIDDFSLDTTIALNGATTGSYQINGDGTGTLVFNFNDGGSAAFAITMASSSKFYLVETDTGTIANQPLEPVASGIGQKQDTASFASLPSGTYILRIHTITNSFVATSSAGAITIAGGLVTGAMDTSRTGSGVSSSTITGNLSSLDATSGRGTGNFMDSISGNSTFIFYVVDSDHILMFSSDTGVQGGGQAEKQASGPFSVASLSGPYAFASGGDTASGPEFSNSVGRFTADGNGGISAGVLDGSADGTPAPNITFTGTYTAANTGRVAVTLNASSGTIQQIYWMVSPSRAFSVLNSSASVEDGSVDLQVGSFSNSTLSGLYAFEMDGFDTNSKQRLGTMNMSGSGTLTLGEVANAGGTSSASTNLTGTYSVTSNGRVTSTVNNLSGNLVFYLISGTDAYVLQNDTGVAIKGTISKQQ